MPNAWITLRHQPPYRSASFADGLQAAGFTPQLRFPQPNEVKKEDVVVTWNLNPRYRGPAMAAKNIGARLIVAENGYIQKYHDLEPYYALARDGHNGAGFWYVGAEDRWAKLEQPLYKWQDNPKGHILIADQRGIGSDIMRCPPIFADNIVHKIKRIFAKHDKRNIPEIRIRTHPGRHLPKNTLAEDLRGARAVVTWASNVANVAVQVGLPTFRIAPYHVNEAVLDNLDHLIDPPHTDRIEAFKKLAWAQWSLAEIQDGTAFKNLLRDSQ